MPRAASPGISCHRPAECTEHLHDGVEQAGRVLDELRSTIDAWSLRPDRAPARGDGPASLESLHEGLETQSARVHRAHASAVALVRRSRNR